MDIYNLQQEIMETFSQKLHLLHGSNLVEAAADVISQLNPIPHLKTIGESMAGFMLIFIYLFFLILHSLVANHQESRQTTRAISDYRFDFYDQQ